MATKRAGIEEVVLLAGSGRSGSTWLADLINHRNEYAYFFEPMHQHHVPEFGMFQQHHYLPPNDPALPYLSPWLRLIATGSENEWVNKHNRNPDSGRTLIKIIRGNLLLPWLQTQLPWMKLVFLLRHPLAVMHSKRKLGWSSDPKLILDQPGLAQHFGGVPREVVDSRDDVTCHVTMWALQNAWPLMALDMERVHVVFYEDLVAHGARELQRLAAYLGHEYDPAAETGLQKPSAVIRKESAVVTGKDPLRSWMEHVSEDERDRAQHVLQVFGLDSLYSAHEALPVV